MSRLNLNSSFLRAVLIVALAIPFTGACVSLVDFWGSILGYSPILDIPSRPVASLTGTSFLQKTRRMSVEEREEAIFEELSSGNVPNHLRRWIAVPVSGVSRDGVSHAGEIYVLPDYLSIGSDEDFVRIPMTPLTAQRVADKWGGLMVTRRVSDIIYANAEVKARPHPMPPGPWMTTSDYYLKHAGVLRRQLAEDMTGRLIAGHKKDVVISNLLFWHPRKVAIYGWHQPNGRAIQPLSIVHPNWYADYSHGIRLMRRHMMVDGQVRQVADILKDPLLSVLLSDEGPFRLTRQPDGNINVGWNASPKKARASL